MIGTIKRIVRKEWEIHRRSWSKCEDCGLSEFRQRVCLMRGTIPCDVLFIGEAPGDSEDTLGYPFVGPAGKLLDVWIADSLSELTFTYAITNVVACKPCDFRGGPFRKPSKGEIEACEGRLTGFIEIAKPRVIVLVGGIARDNFNTTGNPLVIHIQHPAFCLRKGGEKSVQSRENSVKLLCGLEERL